VKSKDVFEDLFLPGRLVKVCGCGGVYHGQPNDPILIFNSHTPWSHSMAACLLGFDRGMRLRNPPHEEYDHFLGSHPPESIQKGNYKWLAKLVPAKKVRS
jgi:hypothetical protein